MAPSSLPDWEIFADEACTQKPEGGVPITDLFVKINNNITCPVKESGYVVAQSYTEIPDVVETSYYILDENYGSITEVGTVELQLHTIFPDMSSYFSGAIDTVISGTNQTLSAGVYKVTKRGSSSVTWEAEYPLSGNFEIAN